MARGIRKTHTEKLQSELSDIRAAIAQYESSLDTPSLQREGDYLRDRAGALQRSKRTFEAEGNDPLRS